MRAQAVPSGHSGSERRPFHTTVTSLGLFARAITSWVVIAAGHSCEDQIRSLPDTIFTTIDSDDICQTQAPEAVFTAKVSRMGPPPCTLVTVGSMVMSAGVHGPDALGVLLGEIEGEGDGVGVGSVDSPPPTNPTSFTAPKTASANTSTAIARRTQKIHCGVLPRGLVLAMQDTVGIASGQMTPATPGQHNDPR